MAVVAGKSENRQKLRWFLKHRPHERWDQFSPDQQEQMVSEDLFAGTSVSMVLVALITAGMLLSTITLAFIIAAS